MYHLMFQLCAKYEIKVKEGMKLKNLFLVVDGLDGVGKSTVVQLLSERLGAITYKTPPKIFRLLKKIISLKNPKFRFWFYLISLIWASIEIRILKKCHSVICDRYICTTIAYHRSIGINMSFFIYFCRYFILMPDRYLYLWVRPEIFKKRMDSRGFFSSGDIVLRRNGKLREKIHQNFLELKKLFKLEVINTSDINSEEVIKLIL